MRNTTTFLLLLFSFLVKAQDYIIFNDDNLKPAILADHHEIDDNGDGEIQFSEAEDFTGSLDISSAGISDPTGLAYFYNLTELIAYDNDMTSIDLSTNDKLETVILNYNQLTYINLANLTYLKDLRIKNNNLTSIDLIQNPNLVNLSIRNNDLVELSVHAPLKYLYASNNQITNLFLFDQDELIEVYADGNNIDIFVISDAPYLTTINCSNNSMDSLLCIEDAPNLTELYIDNNQLQSDDIYISNANNLQKFIANNNLFYETVDLKSFPNLTEINLADNIHLEAIELRNGNNTEIASFDATGCTVLEMVCVDDVDWSTTATGWNIDDVALYGTCIIAVPDAAFEQALIDAHIDYEEDGELNGHVDFLDIKDVTYLLLNNLGIHDLEGINYFTKLESLVANNNHLTGIDVSNLSRLRSLNLKNNNLDSYAMTLPVSSDLRYLYVDNNNDFHEINHFDDVIANQTKLQKLTLADNNAQILTLTNFPALQELNCSDNPDIEELDVSNSLQLNRLEATNCHLEVLDLSGIHSLDYVNVGKNDLTTLVLGAQPLLNALRCNNNVLTSLDLTGAPQLGFVRCNINQLTELSIANNHNLGSLYASDNPITSLDLKNGNNSTLLFMYAKNLGADCCVQVDDESNTPPADTGTTTYDWIIDPTATVSGDCTPDVTYVPDDNFEGALIAMGYDDILDNYVLTENINTITKLNLFAKNISDVTGIQDFIALDTVRLNRNNLTVLDVSPLVNLKYLVCGDNEISNLQIPNGIQYLGLNQNRLTTLDLSEFDYLQKLFCSDNSLTELILPVGNTLEYLECNTNQLTDLNVSNKPNLNDLYCIGNQLTTLDVGSCTNLMELYVASNQLPDINLSNNANLLFFNCTGNQIGILDLTQNTMLVELYCNENELTNLNVSANAELRVLVCSNNDQLRRLDVRNGNNEAILGEDFNANDNPNLYCIEVDNPVWSDAHWSHIDSWVSFNEDCSVELTTEIVGDGVIFTGSTSTTYYIGDSVSLIALPHFGWEFVEWTGDLTGNTSVVTISMDSDKTITAVFALIEYEITTEVTGNGHISVSPDLPGYPYDTEVTITAIPDPGWVFHHWVGDTFDTPSTFTANIYSDITIQAVFLPIPYHLEVNTNGSGNVSVVPLQDTYGYGDEVILTATPNEGWEFTGWTGDLTGNDNPVTVVMDDDKVITANFTEIATEYTLTMTIEGNGTVSISPDQATYQYGDEVTLTAIPEEDHEFDAWTGDIYGNYNPKTITITADVVATAHFSEILPEYTVTLNVVGEGSAEYLTDAIGQTTFEEGSEVVIYAVPEQGWEFVGWSGDYTSNETPDTIIIDGNKVITATFIEIQYNLTVDVDGNGTVELSPNGGMYLEGEEVTLIAIPESGWVFSGWLGDLTGSNTSATIVMDADKNVTALFTEIPSESFTLTVNNDGNGTVVLSPAGGIYNEGDIVTLTVTPATNWEFVGWSGDLTGNDNPATITMNGNKTVTAIFMDVSPPEYTLTLNIIGNGTVAILPNTDTFEEGTVVSLKVNPADGWTFAGWSGDLAGNEHPTTITMDTDKTVTATFVEISPAQYNLTVNTTGNGSVSFSSEGGLYDEGDMVTLTAIPDEGWEFTGWSGDLLGTTNPQSIIMDADKTVMATFAQTVGVNENYLSNHLNIFPNPASSSINVNVTGDLSIEKITILSLDGKILISQNNSGHIGISQLMSGMYFIEITTDIGLSIKKFIKQ